jgi:spermidine synthase
VVEIDDQMKQVAEDYFFLEDHKNLNIIHTDARYYLNTSPKKYDVILGDAYSQLRTVPYQLATYEAIEKKYEALNDDGVVIENIISSLS